MSNDKIQELEQSLAASQRMVVALRELVVAYNKLAPHPETEAALALVPSDLASKCLVERQEWGKAKLVEGKLAALQKQLEADGWSAEMQRALDFIPVEFVRNDAWENGVQRLAEAWRRAKRDSERLNWLQETSPFDEQDIHYRWVKFKWFYFAKDLRAAIDAATSASKSP